MIMQVGGKPQNKDGNIFIFVRIFMKEKLRKVTVFLAFIFSPVALFAQSSVAMGKMEKLADTIYGYFDSNLVRIILAIFLAGSAIAFGFSKDNEKLKRSAVAIFISAAIILLSKEIVLAVWSASGGH